MSNNDALRKAVVAAEEKHGGLRAAARVLMCDPGYLSRLKSGEKENPDELLLRKLGLRRVVVYETIAASMPEPQAQAGEPENSCLCCGHNGEPAAWVIDNPSIYVCKRCHARSNLPRPEIYATEEEGEAFTDGWFDSVEYHREAIAKKNAALKACVEALRHSVPKAYEYTDAAQEEAQRRHISAITQAQEAMNG